MQNICLCTAIANNMHVGLAAMFKMCFQSLGSLLVISAKGDSCLPRCILAPGVGADGSSKVGCKSGAWKEVCYMPALCSVRPLSDRSSGNVICALAPPHCTFGPPHEDTVPRGAAALQPARVAPVLGLGRVAPIIPAQRCENSTVWVPETTHVQFVW